MSAYDPDQPARYRLGGLDLAMVSDGTFYLDAGAVMGLVPRPLWEPVIGTPDARNLTPLALNTLVVRSMGKTILVDTGIGPKLTEKQKSSQYPGDYGHLLRRLHALGIAAEDVDAVVNSHLHFDHCGWNTADVHGRALPTFPKATYYVQRGEYDVAQHPNERTRATYFADNYQPLLESGQLQLVDGEAAVTPEVLIVPTPGHTADHSSVIVSSGGETAIFVGDMAQHAVQLERAAWISAFDVLPLVSLATKKSLLDRALRDGALLLGAHIAYPGAGRLREVDGRRKLVPEAPFE